jgi:hypothetical protein
LVWTIPVEDRKQIMDALQTFTPSTLSVQQWTRILWLGASTMLQPGTTDVQYRDVFTQALILTWNDDVPGLATPQGFNEKQQEASLKLFDALWKCFPKAKESELLWHVEDDSLAPLFLPVLAVQTTLTVAERKDLLEGLPFVKQISRVAEVSNHVNDKKMPIEVLHRSWESGLLDCMRVANVLEDSSFDQPIV